MLTGQLSVDVADGGRHGMLHADQLVDAHLNAGVQGPSWPSCRSLGPAHYSDALLVRLRPAEAVFRLFGSGDAGASPNAIASGVRESTSSTWRC